MPGKSNIISSNASSELRLAGAALGVRVDRRARRLRLRVDIRSGGLLLTIPAGVSRRRALGWAAQHEEWAAEALGALPERVVLGPGSEVPFRGTLHRIELVPDARRGVCLDGDCILMGGPAEGLEPRLLRWLRAEALRLLTAETVEFASKLGTVPVRVGVGDPRSRWGSCSSSGTIRYNWRLILAPDFVRRATVAHEVAHLSHMNHSPSFHALVERLLESDPRPARSWLKREGAALHRIGRS